MNKYILEFDKPVNDPLEDESGLVSCNSRWSFFILFSVALSCNAGID